MATLHVAPEVVPPSARTGVFLAGSIDMGRAANWQATLATALADLDIEIYNPRRAGPWDPAWATHPDHPEFKAQVTWELAQLERAHTIAVVFDPAGQAPITLLELGLHAASGRCVVFCPPTFWRHGNVVLTCARYGVPCFTADWEAFVAAVRARLLAGTPRNR